MSLAKRTYNFKTPRGIILVLLLGLFSLGLFNSSQGIVNHVGDESSDSLHSLTVSHKNTISIPSHIVSRYDISGDFLLSLFFVCENNISNEDEEKNLKHLSHRWNHKNRDLLKSKSTFSGSFGFSNIKDLSLTFLSTVILLH